MPTIRKIQVRFWKRMPDWNRIRKSGNQPVNYTVDRVPVMKSNLYLQPVGIMK